MKINDIVNISSVEEKLMAASFCGNPKLNLGVFRFFRQPWYSSNMEWFRKSYRDLLEKYGTTEDGNTYVFSTKNQSVVTEEFNTLLDVEVDMDGYIPLPLSEDLADFDSVKYPNDGMCLTGIDLDILSNYLKKQGENRD